jgi:hypothetical protein
MSASSAGDPPSGEPPAPNDGGYHVTRTDGRAISVSDGSVGVIAGGDAE